VGRGKRMAAQATGFRPKRNRADPRRQQSCPPHDHERHPNGLPRIPRGPSQWEDYDQEAGNKPRCNSSRRNGAPIPFSNKDNRKQNPKWGLNASSPINSQRWAASLAGAKALSASSAALRIHSARHCIGQETRIGARQQNAGAMANDPLHDHQIGGQRERQPELPQPSHAAEARRTQRRTGRSAGESVNSAALANPRARIRLSLSEGSVRNSGEAQQLLSYGSVLWRSRAPRALKEGNSRLAAGSVGD
jgi:hypothetical protein